MVKHHLIGLVPLEEVHDMLLPAAEISAEAQGEIAVLNDRRPILDDFHGVLSVRLIVFLPEAPCHVLREDGVDPVHIRTLGVVPVLSVLHPDVRERTHLLVPVGRSLHVRRKDGRLVVQLEIHLSGGAVGLDGDKCVRIVDGVVGIVIVQARMQRHRPQQHTQHNKIIEKTLHFLSSMILCCKFTKYF